MKLSKAVIDRADALAIEYNQLCPLLKILWLIGLVDTSWTMVEEMQRYSPSKVSKWIDIGLDAQCKLKAINIIDDATAIVYMDEIEPRLKEYLIHYKFMIQRHQEEIQRFTERLRF
jgi:hypothetical protein